jgi:hypothetical protein
MKTRTACRIFWTYLKQNGFETKPTLIPSFRKGEAPFCDVVVTDKGGNGHEFKVGIDDIVGNLAAAEQPAARKYFGITDEQWSRWEPTAGKTCREQQAEEEKTRCESIASGEAASGGRDGTNGDDRAES